MTVKSYSDSVTSKSRKIYMSLFTVFLLWIGVAAPQTPSTASRQLAQANQQKARAFVDRMIQALGGQAYLNLQDAEAVGRYGRFYHGSSESSAVYHRFWQWPDKERLEFTKARDIIDLFIGDSLYETTSRGTRQVDVKKDPELQLFFQRRRHALEIVVRQWLTAPGTALFYEGLALAENHRTERVTIMNAANDSVTLFIDSHTHLPVKKEFVVRDPQTRDRDAIAEVYDNWKMVQGINTPYNTLVLKNGELLRQYFLSSVSYNNHLPSALFEPGPISDRMKK
jgi:hypothetical protein